MVETDPEKRLIGYAHVSTWGQSLDSQLEQFRAGRMRQPKDPTAKVTVAAANRRDRAIVVASTDRAFDNLS